MTNLAHADGSPENQKHARAFIDRLESAKILHPPSKRDEVEKTLFLLLNAIASGKAVHVVEEKEELTPSEAAKFLNISRPFLDKLLKQGFIPFKTLPASKHRRILKQDIECFKRDHDKKARKALREVTKISEEIGLDD